MLSREKGAPDWLRAIDEHLEGVEKAIQKNNIALAEAELLAARTKLWQLQVPSDRRTAVTVM